MLITANNTLGTRYYLEQEYCANEGMLLNPLYRIEFIRVRLIQDSE